MSEAAPSSPGRARRIDGHVHLVGNGHGGSGCWLRVKGWWHRPLAEFMLRQIGLRGVGLDSPEFDTRYVEHLRELRRTSSLDALVLLAQDETRDDAGRRVEFGSFHVPNDYVLALARQYPEFLPGVSIHPGRPDALEELERCLAGGAALLKLLPNCQNVNCSDRRYTRFWERMAEARLPLLAHTGGEHTLPQIAPAMSDPRTLRLPLSVGVTVIAAHSGTKSGVGDPDYFEEFVRMLGEFPNLYGDTSALVSLNRCRRLVELATTDLAQRVVHGSDYPVPALGHRLWWRGDMAWSEWRRWQACPNPLERDYRMKLALGFGDDHFTRLESLLRPASR